MGAFIGACTIGIIETGVAAVGLTGLYTVLSLAGEGLLGRLQLFHRQVPQPDKDVSERFLGVFLLFRHREIELFLSDDPAFDE